jgi:hypothetical protein
MGQQTPFSPCPKRPILIMPFELSVNDCCSFLRNVEHRKSFAFLFATFQKVSVGWSLSRFYFPFPERPNGHYTCAHTQLVQQQDARCTTNLATWWWWWRLVGTHKYSSIIIGLYDPSFSLSLFVRSFFFFFFCLFEISFSSFLLEKRKEKRETLLLFSNVCACAVTLARPRLRFESFYGLGDALLVLYSLELCFYRLCARSGRQLYQHTHRKENGDEIRECGLFFFFQKEKGAIQNGNDLRAEEEEEAQNVSTPGQVRPRVKYRRRIIIWIGIDIALYSPGGFWR